MDTPVMPPIVPALPDVLQAAAAELLQLAINADALGVCQAAGSSEQWQSLDRISQHLGELSNFLLAVSYVIPDIRPDLAPALAAVRVGALAARLAAREVVEDDDPGELELFDA